MRFSVSQRMQLLQLAGNALVAAPLRSTQTPASLPPLAWRSVYAGGKLLVFF